MLGWLFWLPVLLIALAAFMAFTFVRLSTLHITSDGIEIRNYPQDARVVPLENAQRFVPTEPVGVFRKLRPATATLVCSDGSRIPVRSLRDAGGAFGIDALNHRLAAVRRAG